MTHIVVKPKSDFDGTLFFANSHDFIVAAQRAINASEPPLQVVLIDGESNDIDATAIITLQEFQEKLAKNNIQLWFARVKANVMVVMERGGLEEAIPAEHFYESVQTAVDAYLGEQEMK